MKGCFMSDHLHLTRTCVMKASCDVWCCFHVSKLTNSMQASSMQRCAQRQHVQRNSPDCALSVNAHYDNAYGLNRSRTHLRSTCRAPQSGLFLPKRRMPATNAVQEPNECGSSFDRHVIMGMKLPGQAESLFTGCGSAEELISRVTVTETTKSYADLDYLTELLAIQQSDGPKNIGFFGTRNMGVTHQKLVEILSYAYASTVSAKSCTPC